MPANIYRDLPAAAAHEHFLELLSSRGGVRIERIVSYGQASATDDWFEQPHGEWVMVLVGEGRLRFQEEEQPYLLGPGDYLDIPPFKRHRVESTHPAHPTVWLAVHYGLQAVKTPSAE